MKKILFTIMATALIASDSFAHKEWVHQYMIQEAYHLLNQTKGINANVYNKLDFGIDYWGNAPRNFFGAGIDADPFSHACPIAVGAWREDVDDVVYNFGNGGNCIEPSVTHFWEADKGDNDHHFFVGCSNSYGAPNAFQKALILLFNGNSHILTVKKYANFFVHHTNSNYSSPLNFVVQEWKINYNTLFDVFYGNFTVQPVLTKAQLNALKNVGQPAPSPLAALTSPFWMNTGRFVSLQLLGHVAHLLGDMSVPAHAHNAAHPCMLGLGDVYELEMGGSLAVADCSAAPDFNNPLNCLATAYTAQTALQQGDLLNEIDCMNDFDAIHYLFYSTNQLADFFPSGANFPSANVFTTLTQNVPGNAFHQAADATNNLLNAFYAPFQNTPPTPINSQLIAQTTFNYAIRSCATLFYWFERRLQAYRPITVIQNSNFSNHVSLDALALHNQGAIYQTVVKTKCYGTSLIWAGSTITPAVAYGDVIIPNGAETEFLTSPNGYISLSPGFSAQNGSIFKALAIPFNCGIASQRQNAGIQNIAVSGSDTIAEGQERIGFAEISKPNLSIQPNPIQNQATIYLYLAADANVRIELKNALGQTVKIVLNKDQVTAGNYPISLDRENIVKGVYFINAFIGTEVINKTIILQ